MSTASVRPLALDHFKRWLGDAAAAFWRVDSAARLTAIAIDRSAAVLAKLTRRPSRGMRRHIRREKAGLA